MSLFYFAKDIIPYLKSNSCSTTLRRRRSRWLIRRRISRPPRSRPGHDAVAKKFFLIGGAFPVAYKGANIRKVDVEELA